jgi:uncharacterized protein
LIALDTNILVYAHRLDMPFHDTARALVAAKAVGTDPWALPWPCVHEFLSIVTNPRVFRQPTPVNKAVRQVRAWLGAPAVVILNESDGYLDVLASLLETSGVAGAKVHDARIAALCLSHGVAEIWTADRDFSRFPSVVTRNPLIVSR